MFTEIHMINSRNLKSYNNNPKNIDPNGNLTIPEGADNFITEVQNFQTSCLTITSNTKM